MPKNKKGIYGNKSLLVGAALLGGYIFYKGVVAPREDNGEGSLGGTDELLGQQGFDIDPNSVPDQPQEDPAFYVITPEGQIVPENTLGAGTDGGVGFPSDVPIASTGTGTLFQDAAATGGAIGGNLMLPSIAKRINKLIDTKYLTSSVDDAVKQTPWNKFIKDPYRLNNFNDLAVSKATKTGTGEVAELAIDKSGKVLLKTIPKWAKATKTVANFIPLLDIPIGAGLDVYFNRYEEDESKKINWGDAIAANTAGELAQLGITGGAAAAGSVVPVAGTIAGGVGGFIVGTGADIAATEGYYAARGKSSLFTGSSGSGSGSASSYTPPSAAQASTVAKLTGQSSFNFSTNTFTSAQGYQSSMSTTDYLKSLAPKPAAQLFTPAPNPFSGGGGSSSSSSSRTSSSGGGSSSSSSSRNTSSNVTKSSSAKQSSSSRSSTPRTAPKTSVVSRVSSVVRSAPKRAVSRVKSVASRVSRFRRRVSSRFRRRKK